MEEKSRANLSTVKVRYRLTVKSPIVIQQRMCYLFPEHARSMVLVESQSGCRTIAPGSYDLTVNRSQIEYERDIQSIVVSSKGAFEAAIVRTFVD